MNPRPALKTRWHWPGVLAPPSTKPAASATTRPGGQNFRWLLDELATLTKNLVAPVGAADTRFWQLSQPTPLQERAFQLLGIKLRVAKTPAA